VRDYFPVYGKTIRKTGCQLKNWETEVQNYYKIRMSVRKSVKWGNNFLCDFITIRKSGCQLENLESEEITTCVIE
jgi:hypothetical protein